MRRRILFVLCALLLMNAACGEDAEPRSNSVSHDVGPDADAGDRDGGDSGDDTDLPEKPWPVDEAGPYNVGYTEREVTYEADGIDEPRTLRVAVWYPTFDTDGAKARYYNLFNRDGIWAEASIALEEPAPLLLFSHGNGALAEQSFFMTEFFASHGWLVVAPDHTGNTVSDTDGSIDMSSAVYRPQDMSAVLDEMLALPEDDALSEYVDEEAIAMSGHSFGGFTTLANTGAEFAVDELEADCQAQDSRICDILVDDEAYADIFKEGFGDQRIKAGIPQAPGGYEAFRAGLADIDTPTLLFTGAKDKTLPNEVEGDPIWDAMEGSSHMRIDLERGGHFTFSNMCEFFSDFEQVNEDGCSSEFIEPEAAYSIINTYSLAFLRYHLFDDESVEALLEGEEALEETADEYEMSHKPD